MPQQQTADDDNVGIALAEEINWFQNVNSLIESKNLENGKSFFWAAYHCNAGLIQSII